MFCCQSDQILFLIVLFVLLSFLWINNLNFLLHSLDIFKSFKGSAHLVVIKCPRRRNDLEKQVAFTVLSSVFPAASPLTLTTQPTRLCSCAFNTQTFRPRLCKSSSVQGNFVSAHTSLRAFQSHHPRLLLSGALEQSTRILLLPYNKILANITFRVHGFPTKNRIRINSVHQGLECFGC